MTRPKLVALLVALLVGAPQAAELRVPQDYPSIQLAVDAAHPGDRIVVAPGTYPENVVVEGKKGLRLIGEGEAVIDGGGGASALSIVESKAIRVEGLVLQDAWDVLTVLDASRVRIRDCHVLDAGHDGLSVDRSLKVILQDTLLEEVGYNAVELGEDATRCRILRNTMRSCGSKGIRVRGDRNRVLENDIAYCGDDGIGIWSDRNRVLRNTITWCLDDGVELWGGAHNRFVLNTITNIEEVGFQIEEGYKNRFVRNEVTDARGCGFWVFCADNRIVRNTVTGCSPHGIWMDHGGNVVARNHVTGCSVFDLFETEGLEQENTYKNNVVGTTNLDL